MKVFEAPPSFEREAVLDLIRLADDSEKEIGDYLYRGRLFLLSEEPEVRPVGQTLVIQTHSTHAEIKSLSISDQRQGQGLGSLMVRAVLSALRKDGTSCVSVATSTADINNIAFYQRLGFRCLKIERDVYTAAKGYPENLQINGMLARDKIWFDVYL